MSQIINGVRSILSHPSVYDSLQNLFGAHSFRINFADRFIRAREGNRILDLGCGTAEILNYLPSVLYFGFDISHPYIDAAKKRFGRKGTFEARILEENEAGRLEKFDIVLALGVMHHLDDRFASDLLKTAYAALKPGGRFISFDPVIANGQNVIARYLISKDRGQNVRREAGYLALVQGIFSSVQSTVSHQSWIPYTHCFIEAVR